MGMFKKATNEQAYLKCGVMGFAGAGKTFTATQIAIGLVRYARDLKIAGADKPVMFLDTETGSDWVRHLFEDNHIELQVAKTRAFTDMLAAVDEAEEHGFLMMIDSVSHFWRDLTDSYARRK